MRRGHRGAGQRGARRGPVHQLETICEPGANRSRHLPTFEYAPRASVGLRRAHREVPPSSRRGHRARVRHVVPGGDSHHDPIVDQRDGSRRPRGVGRAPARPRLATRASRPGGRRRSSPSPRSPRNCCPAPRVQDANRDEAGGFGDAVCAGPRRCRDVCSVSVAVVRPATVRHRREAGADAGAEVLVPGVDPGVDDIGRHALAGSAVAEDPDSGSARWSTRSSPHGRGRLDREGTDGSSGSIERILGSLRSSDSAAGEPAPRSRGTPTCRPG